MPRPEYGALRLVLQVITLGLVLGLGPGAALASQVTTEQLTDDAVEQSHPRVSEPGAVWVEGTGNSSEVVEYDGVSATPLSSPGVEDVEPHLAGSAIAVKETSDSSICSVVLRDGGDTTLDSDILCTNDVRIHMDRVIWTGPSGGGEDDVFLYDGSLPPTQLGTSELSESQARISDDGGTVKAVWIGDALVYYDGTTPIPLLGSNGAADPEIDGADAVWAQFDGMDEEIYFYDGSTITQITDNDYPDRVPDVSGGVVVWEAHPGGGDGNIMMWAGGVTTPVTTDSVDDMAPRISGSSIAWIGHDGNDNEIFFYDGCEINQITDNDLDDADFGLDGETLLWIQNDGDDGEVWKATVSCDPVCGDGIEELPETCDDSNTVAGDGCSPVCTIEECGSGVIDPGEECDDGNTAGDDGCDAACLLECGNGVINGIEECDDGNTVAGDTCSPVCTLEVCGSGVIDPGEECDDGNTSSGDGCDAACQDECPNGVVDTGEQCDDGNSAAADGCSALCMFEVCGNAVLDPGEECDDGNTVSGDGCSTICETEIPISKAQQKCILELNKRGANVAKAQQREQLSCLKNAAKGKTDKLGTPATAQDCLMNDPAGKVAKARSKTQSGETKKCDPADLPTFGYTDSATVNTASQTEPLACMDDVFGPDLDAALVLKATDPTTAKCQEEVLKKTQVVADFLFKMANKQKKKALKGAKGVSPVRSAGALELAVMGYVEADAKGKAQKKVDKLVAGVNKRCSAVAGLAAAFPGCAPATAADLGSCAAAAGRCRFCRSYNGMDALAADCDVFDDGAANASCP